MHGMYVKMMLPYSEFK